MILHKHNLCLWVFASITILAFPLCADEKWGLSTLMATLSAQNNDKVKYVEEKHFSFMEQDIVSHGVLLYRPPDMLIREEHSPGKSRSVVTGMNLTIFPEDGDQRTVDLGDYPQARIFIDTLRATLTGDAKALQHLFEIRLDGNPRQWTIRLQPRDASLNTLVTEVILRGRNNRLQSIKISETGGDFSLMHLAYDDN